MYWVYILKNSQNRIYIGQTNNLDSRIKRHNNNEEISTKNRGLFNVIHQEIYRTRSEAMRREKQLKSGKGREWIKNNLL